MSYPEPYVQTYSYTGFQQSQGDNSFPGTYLDDDLAGIAEAIGALVTFQQAAFRSDGALANGSVTKEALGSDILLGVPTPTVWATGAAYAQGDAVSEGAALYSCQAAHTAGASFASDYGSGLWALICTLVTPSVYPDASIPTAALVDGAVSDDKLADNAVTTAKIADAAVTSAKLAASVGQTPIGAVLGYAGIKLPSGFLWADGAAVARTGAYAGLFSALTLSVLCGSYPSDYTLYGLSEDLSGLGLEGAVVEHPDFPAGTTIVSATATTVLLSNPSSGSTLGGVARIFPYGAGDGSSTFNVPDYRDRSQIGRGNMGGSDAGRVVSLAGLGAAGGEEKHALTSGELAAHSHAVTDGGHSHGVTDAGHVHSVTNYVKTGGGLSFSASGGVSIGPQDTQTAVTGISVNSGATGITIASAGSGTAHNTLHPVQVCNFIVFAGA